jgi:hypothetical protein
MELRKSIQTFYKTVIESSSDEEADDDTELMMAAAMLLHEHTSRPVFRGSVKGHKPNVKCNREKGHYQLYRDYFHPTNPIFDAQRFWRRYRMSRKLFLTILNGVRAHDSYFTARPDATGKLGFTFYQKSSAAIRMLAYGVVGDLIDEYLRMSESTCLESMYKFYNTVIAVFGTVYLREATIEDTARLLLVIEERGFLRMIGSIDCMHWEWKNCPFAWQGQYSGHAEGFTVIHEVMASQDLWIWHYFLAWPAPTMTSTCSSVLRSLQG